MQTRMMQTSSEGRDIILLSPTGSGKTLAFSLALLKFLKPSTGRVQAVIIAPSRELVIQISGVLGAIASGFKVTPLYGGHKVEDEVNSLAAGTDIIVATPGRLLDHMQRRNVELLPTRILVLDEFDKSLELGFEKEMKKIVERLKNVSRVILTSATRADILPEFLSLNNPVTLDYLGGNERLRNRMRVHRVDSDANDKLDSLLLLLRNIAAKGDGVQRMIIFVNHRESAERVSQFLQMKGMPAVLYHGALDQRDREKALAMFNNGTRPLLVATDLAARGLDIRDVRGVVHYHQPLTAETYTHRNGRTARVEAEGDIYVLVGPEETVKDYISFDDTYRLDNECVAVPATTGDTIYVSAGKREKISRGDLLGFIVKQCGIPAEAVGKIDVYDHYALVSLAKGYAPEVVAACKLHKIKGSKRLLTLLP